MKLGLLVNNNDTLARLYNLELTGKRVFKLRKILRNMESEIKIFEETKNQYIMQHGKKIDEIVQVVQGTKEFNKMVEILNDMLDTDIEVDIDFKLTEEEISEVKFSARDIDSLIDMELLEI